MNQKKMFMPKHILRPPQCVLHKVMPCQSRSGNVCWSWRSGRVGRRFLSETQDPRIYTDPQRRYAEFCKFVNCSEYKILYIFDSIQTVIIYMHSISQHMHTQTQAHTHNWMNGRVNVVVFMCLFVVLVRFKHSTVQMFMQTKWILVKNNIK